MDNFLHFYLYIILNLLNIKDRKNIANFINIFTIRKGHYKILFLFGKYEHVKGNYSRAPLFEHVPHSCTHNGVKYNLIIVSLIPHCIPLSLSL